MTGAARDRGAAIRPPQQRRSQKSLERILQAGADVLREEGYEGFTLQEVSRRAKVSIGSIYARAESKDVLFRAIYEREIERMTQDHSRIEFTPREGLHGRAMVISLVEQMSKVVLANSEMLQVIMHRAVMDPDVWQAGSTGLRKFAKAFERVMLAHRDEIAHNDPELAVDIAFRFVYATLARRISHGPNFESDRELPDSVLVGELATAAADYLIGPGPPKRRQS